MGALAILDKFSAPARVQRLSVFALGTVLLVLFLENFLFPETSLSTLQRRGSASRSKHYRKWGNFEPMPIPGFVNTGLPGKRSCDTLRYNSTVGVQQSFHLDDDIHQIAMALDHHPIVDYPDEMMNDPDMGAREIINKTWTRLSGSSVWLPQYNVYLSVTRVIFSPSRTRAAPKMSFLRGQLFDENWEHLDNRTITWAGKRFTFPMVFDIPAQTNQEGDMYGPEDPQVVLEHGVEDAEPVIVFNMVGRKSDWKRAMYLYRPFSHAFTILTIQDSVRLYSEKNWAPFFIPEQEQQTLLGKLPITVPGVLRRQNEYVHFVYSFRPLRILRCHMRCGDCEFEYEQDLPSKAQTREHDETSIRGGTNFVPVSIPANMDIDSRVRVYAAFSQTNIGKYCDGNFYRPEFSVMIKVGRQFQLAFASETLDFGNAIVEVKSEEDRCERGRILTPKTVARWDTAAGQDVMTVAFSVNDETTQIARLSGLLDFVRNLPQFSALLKRDGLMKGANADLVSLLSTWTGDDVRGCLVESAGNYTGYAHKDDLDDDMQETDTFEELIQRLNEIHAEEMTRTKDKAAAAAAENIAKFNQPGAPIMEHPPAEAGNLFNPAALGEFRDVEGLPVEGFGFADAKKDDKKKEDGTHKEPGKKIDHIGELEHPVDRAPPKDKMGQLEDKPLNPVKADDKNNGVHRYHKPHNHRRSWR